MPPVARAELSRALGVDELPPLAGPLDEGLDAESPLGATSAVEDLPIVRRAVADSIAARARYNAASIARLPFPSVIAGLEWGPHETPTNHIFGFAIPVPLFNSGGALRREANALASVAAARAGEERLAAQAALASVRVRRDEAALRSRFLRDTLFPVAQRLRAGSVRLLDEGRADLLPVLDAMRGERDAAQSLVTELVRFQAASADYLALIGRTEW